MYSSGAWTNPSINKDSRQVFEAIYNRGVVERQKEFGVDKKVFGLDYSGLTDKYTDSFDVSTADRVIGSGLKYIYSKPADIIKVIGTGAAFSLGLGAVTSTLSGLAGAGFTKTADIGKKFLDASLIGGATLYAGSEALEISSAENKVDRAGESVVDLTAFLTGAGMTSPRTAAQNSKRLKNSIRGNNDKGLLTRLVINPVRKVFSFFKRPEPLPISESGTFITSREPQFLKPISGVDLSTGRGVGPRLDGTFPRGRVDIVPEPVTRDVTIRNIEVRGFVERVDPVTGTKTFEPVSSKDVRQKELFEPSSTEIGFVARDPLTLDLVPISKKVEFKGYFKDQVFVRRLDTNKLVPAESLVGFRTADAASFRTQRKFAENEIGKLISASTRQGSLKDFIPKEEKISLVSRSLADMSARAKTSKLQERLDALPIEKPLNTEVGTKVGTKVATEEGTITITDTLTSGITSPSNIRTVFVEPRFDFVPRGSQRTVNPLERTEFKPAERTNIFEGSMFKPVEIVTPTQRRGILPISATNLRFDNMNSFVNDTRLGTEVKPELKVDVVTNQKVEPIEIYDTAQTSITQPELQLEVVQPITQTTVTTPTPVPSSPSRISMMMAGIAASGFRPGPSNNKSFFIRDRNGRLVVNPVISLSELYDFQKNSEYLLNEEEEMAIKNFQQSSMYKKPNNALNRFFKPQKKAPIAAYTSSPSDSAFGAYYNPSPIPMIQSLNSDFMYAGKPFVTESFSNPYVVDNRFMNTSPIEMVPKTDNQIMKERFNKNANKLISQKIVSKKNFQKKNFLGGPKKSRKKKVGRWI